MQITPESEEATILREAPARYRSDPRAETGTTDGYGTRQEMHQHEAVLGKVIVPLSA